jgi:hypothetical protein
MTVLRVDSQAPTFYINTADLVGGDHFVGSQSFLGANVYNVDTNLWYVIDSGGLLKSYTLPIALAGSTASIGKVSIDQTTPGITNGVQLTAGENFIGKTVGSTAVITATPVITGGLYHVNDCVGPKLEFINAARISGAPVTIQSLVITDLAMQNAPLNFFIFQGNPATGTYTDNAECAINDTDLIQCVGVLSSSDGQWVSAKDNSVLTMQNIGLVISPTTTSVWVVTKTTGTPTYVTTSDLVIKIGFYRE